MWQVILEETQEQSLQDSPPLGGDFPEAFHTLLSNTNSFMGSCMGGWGSPQLLVVCFFVPSEIWKTLPTFSGLI